MLHITDSERYSAPDLTTVIAGDPALTAKILRLANSAYYGYPRRVRTVDEAVVLMGSQAVRSTAIATAIMDLFPAANVGAFSIDLFWGHNVACGFVAEANGHTAPDEVFTQALGDALTGSGDLAAAEARHCGYDHSRVGEGLARRWRFPEELCLAIGQHHQSPSGPEDRGLPSVVSQANSVC